MQVLILQGQKHEVSFLCPSPDGVHVAVGYEDGAVRIFSLLNGESSVAFNGHKTAVTVMNYDALGARLVTGSKVSGVRFCRRPDGRARATSPGSGGHPVCGVTLVWCCRTRT